MKILYFLAHPENIGGAMKVLLTQAYIMQKHGNQVMVVIQNNDENTHIPEYEKLCATYGLEYVAAQYPIAVCIENIDIITCMNSYKRVKNIVERYEPNLIHSVQLNTVAEYIARELNIPHIMNIYQISDGMFNIKWMDVFPQYQSGDSIFYCKKWQTGLGIESRCIRVAYACDKEVKDKKSALQQNKIEIINIAAFSPHKRQFEIIKFIEECKNNGFFVHIRFLGTDQCEYADKCKEYVNSHNLNDEVTFEGLVMGVEKYLCMSDIMIHASTCESYPGVIVEAMGNHVPVIATPVAGVPELLQDEVNGFLTKGYQADDLYEAFVRYIALKNENRIADIINSAYDTYLSNHTYEVTFQKLDEYYRYILNNNVKSKERFWKMESSFEKVLQFGNSVNINLYSTKTQNALWFLYHIKQIMDDKSYCTAVIWGAGFYGRIAMEWCRILSLNVIGIMDRFKTGVFENVEISPPDIEIIKKTDVVFLAMINADACEQNIRFIEKAGKVRNVDYFLTCNNPCIQGKWT